MSDAAHDLIKQAQLARREHRLEDAKRDLTAAVALCRKAGGRTELARALAGLAQIERDLRQGDVALQHYEEAAGLYRVEGDALRLAHTIRHVGDIHQEEGRTKRAEPCYREALEIYRGSERTTPLDLANAIRGYAILKDGAGTADEARSLWTEARELYASVNVQAGVEESERRLKGLELKG